MGRAKPPLFWLRFPNEVTSCPACSSTRTVLLDVFKIPRDRRGRRVAFLTGCHECGLLFANPLPTQEDLQLQYSQQGAWAAARKARASQPRAGPAAARDPRDVLLEALRPYVPVHAAPAGARVIDFGCGDGKFLDRLQDAGWETYGIEPSTDAAFRRHRRLDQPPGGATFDFGILHHVLEHLSRPLHVLHQLAGALREGAPLFIGVPRLETLSRHRDFKYCIDGRHHLVCLSRACLETLLARAGFTVTAWLQERALDDEITGGKPLRLRLVATRTARAVSTPERPLTPALAALAAYGSPGGVARRLRAMLPVRMRGAMLDRAIERRAWQRRRDRERSAVDAGKSHGETTGG